VLAMNKTTYDRLPSELKTVIDANSGQAAAGMAGNMWDLEARAVAELVSGRGDPITVLDAQNIVPWRKATEPVVDSWLKEMRARKIDGAGLIATANALLAKYADEPEPEPPKPTRPEPAEPTPTVQAPQPAQAKAQAPDLPKPANPVARPSAKPGLLKELDIPL